jgi:hypothetical protein
MTEILEEKVTDVNLFLKKVAIQKGMQNPEVWAQQVENKFEKIGIRKVSDIMMNVFRINHALKKKELSQFYMETLREMFQEGIHTIAEEEVDFHVLNLVEDVSIYKYGPGNNQ